MKMPSLVLTRRAKLMLRYACEAFPNREVQGFGSIEKGDDGDLWVTDIFIPKQEVTSSSVDLKPEDLERVMLELSEKGQTLSQWPVWWHSHGNMATNPSNTDTNTLQMLAKEYDGVALGLVTNKSGDYHGWWAGTYINEYGEFPMSGKMDVLYEVDDDPELGAIVKSMMKENVKEHKYTQPSGAPGQVRRFGQGWWSNGTFHPFGSHSDRLHTVACASVPGNCISPELCAVVRQVQPGLSKKELKRIAKGEREQLAVYYKHMQSQYAVGSMQRNMSLKEFEEWFDQADADDLPLAIYGGGLGGDEFFGV